MNLMRHTLTMPRPRPHAAQRLSLRQSLVSRAMPRQLTEHRATISHGVLKSHLRLPHPEFPSGTIYMLHIYMKTVMIRSNGKGTSQY